MFACPIAECTGTSANRQGVVAHLRIVHKLEKAERDALMANLGGAPVAAPAAAPKPRPAKPAAPEFSARIERWLEVPNGQ